MTSETGRTTSADGVLVVDKPGGLTSHGVVARVRRLAGTRKVGHAGTLDPMATGVLVLGVGRATRLLGRLALTDKAYDATIRLGVTTTTDDAEGDVVETAGVVDPDGADRVTDAALGAAVADLTGALDQVPSAVSAVKVDGKRAYARVRAGEEVELAPRPVVVSRFDVLAVRRDASGATLDLDVTVECTTGTYVRALARDLGAALGTGGHLTALRRTRVGPFRLASARTLDALAERYEIMPLGDAAALAFPCHRLTADQAAAVRHGRPLTATGAGPGPVAVYAPDGRFLALVEDDGGRARSLAVFAGTGDDQDPSAGAG